LDKAGWISGFRGQDLFDFDLEMAVDLIEKSRAKIVGIQVPEGLKRTAPFIAREIEERTGAKVIISGDPCYGACDVDMELCRNVDLLIHIGHSEMLSGDPELDKVIYLEARMKADVKDVVTKAASLLKSKRVGVITTVQHYHKIDEIIETLKERGIEGIVGSGGERLRYPGQVLGCNYDAAKCLDVDEYLFVGTGKFHPIGVALSTGKRVIVADPISSEAMLIDPDPMIKRRYGAIARAMDARKVAVLISKKPGQERWIEAQKMMDLGKKHDRDMILVYLDRIEPDVLINLGVEAAVCTACPRIALDDQAKYPVPMLTPPEFEILLGGCASKNYILDEIE